VKEKIPRPRKKSAGKTTDQINPSTNRIEISLKPQQKKPRHAGTREKTEKGGGGNRLQKNIEPLRGGGGDK